MSPRVTSLHSDLFLASLWGSGDLVVLGVTLLYREKLSLPTKEVCGTWEPHFALRSLPETAILNKGGRLSPSGQPCLPLGNDLVP